MPLPKHFVMLLELLEHQSIQWTFYGIPGATWVKCDSCKFVMPPHCIECQHCGAMMATENRLAEIMEAADG